MHNVVIHQPQFLPYEGFWHRLLYADTFVVLGGAKFSQGGHGHRVTIDGEWLTLPVKGHQRTLPYHAVELADEAPEALYGAVDKIKAALAGDPYADRLKPIYEALLMPGYAGHDKLLQFQMSTMIALRNLLGLRFDFVLDVADRPGMDAATKLDDILAPIRDQHGPLRYLSAPTGRNYIGRHSLGVPEAVAFQYLDHKLLCPDSVVQLIARCADPIAAISMNSWEDHDGQPLDLDRPALAGDRASP